MKIESLLIHGGIDGDESTGAVNIPICKPQPISSLLWGLTRVMNIQELAILLERPWRNL